MKKVLLSRGLVSIKINTFYVTALQRGTIIKNLKLSSRQSKRLQDTTFIITWFPNWEKNNISNFSSAEFAYSVQSVNKTS